MLKAAIRDDDPVLFLENLALYNTKGEVPDHVEPAEIGKAAVTREGSDITIIGYSRMAGVATQVAEKLHDEDGINAEVVDLRSISPLDTATVVESVRRTGRCVVVHEAPTYLGSGAEVAARVTEECFYSLEAPVLRVGGFHTPFPVAKIEHDYLPSLDRVLDAVDRAFAF